MSDNICPDCGAGIPSGMENCRQIFDEVLAREFSDFRYGRVHRMTVDAYSLQHPDSFLKSFTSHAAHLTGLCWAFEYDGSPKIGKALKRWYDSKPQKQKVREPEEKGKKTIADIHKANDPDDHVKLVREWAWEAWQAWAESHETVRSWVKEATGSR